MLKKTKLLSGFTVFCLLLLGCKKSPVNSTYAPCDGGLYNTCTGKDNGAYCTFGIKWGALNPFPNPGVERSGPSVGNIELSYKFMDAGFSFSTHSQQNLTSLSFNDYMLGCAKAKFKEAFDEWASVTNVNFREVQSNEVANIKIIVSDIQQASIGYPNFSQRPCSDLAGLIIFKKNYYNSCQTIYGPILHEIGHTLGLGHVNSKNVMHPSESYLYNSLQPGDIIGIQSIYGIR